MRIIVDMQGLQTNFSAHRGVGRYTRSLVRELILNKGQHEIFLVLNGHFVDSARTIRTSFSKILPNTNILTWQQQFAFHGCDLASYPAMHCAEILRDSFIYSLKPDVVFSTNLQEGFFESAPTSVKKYLLKDVLHVSTLHDVTPLLQPETYLGNPTTKAWYDGKIADAIKSDIIVTVSDSSRGDIEAHCCVDKNKVYTVHNAIDKLVFNCDHPIDENLKKLPCEYGIHKPFFMYSGGNDEHKNLRRLYDAFALLSNDIKSKYQLVLVGKELKTQESEIRQLLDKLKINESVVFTGFIDDEVLVALYRTCFAFIFPSISEGFGLPLLEAMSCGAVSLSSNVSSMKEINANSSAWFDPYNSGHISAKMREIIENQSLYNELKQYSIVQSSKFSWAESARKLISIIENKYTKCAHDKNIPRDFVDLTVELMAAVKNVENISTETLKAISQSIAETFPRDPNRKNRLYLDVSAMTVTGDRTGIQRVVRSICFELLTTIQCDLQVIPIYKSPEEVGFHVAEQLINEIIGSSKDSIISHSEFDVDFIADDVLLFLDLHPSLAISHINRTNSLIARGVKVYHLVYDLLPIKYRECFWPSLCDEFENWVKTTLKSSGVICISKSVSKQIDEYISAAKIDVEDDFKNSWFHLGANINSSLPTKGISKSESNLLNTIQDKFTFIMVGTVEPRKKQDEILSVFERLWIKRDDVNLLFVGKKGWGMDDFYSKVSEHPRNNANLFWPQNISDECLEQLYSKATCLIAASLDEGFGLPLIEAAQHKIPIIARDIPVFREVAGDCAYYFKGNNYDAVAQEILEWIGLFMSGQHPKSELMPWLTWRQSAQQLLNAIGLNSCLGN